MTSQDRGPQIALASEINVLLGVWLIISPFFYTISAPATASATWNNVIVGILIVICAALRTFSHQRRVALSGVNIVLGIWTLICPRYLDLDFSLDLRLQHGRTAVWDQHRRG